MTLEEVARLSKVSRSTVSRVVNNDPHVQAETRERVLQIITQVGYQPSAAARSLATGRTRVLRLVIPQGVVALFADRIKGWLRRAGRISHYVEVLAGVVLVLVGVLLFTGTFTALNTFFLRITPEWLQRYL